MLGVQGISGMTSPKHSHWKFGFVLTMGALVALALCVQCVRTYFYAVKVLIPQQAEEDAARQAAALSAAARSAGIDDPHNLTPLLHHVVQSAVDRLRWVRVRDAGHRVISQAGNPPASAKLPERWWDAVQKHENRGTLINT